ncbi:hypothetical protein NQ317_012628 [Molorchus minor]|uniref:Methionyl-tRNA formyltransferase, mitochondrial n=1 Tax=Molorchus minor TaxID=1323400 RepID=A0ABQ9J4R2_9CUCU|nr:hypothetical protein NQ317_012628 [Molorchus minor]
MNIAFKSSIKLTNDALQSIRTKSNFTQTPPWNVLFFGTDDFSVYSLRSLYNKRGSIINQLGIVTTTIRKGKLNPVRKFASEHKITVHSWPEQIPTNLNHKPYDIGLVASFGHLIPESVINQFHYGMINVHASLLPRWRGAAPIIYALANGDKETGVTIMRIRPKHFDIGEILMQAKIPITDDMTLPDLHEKLGNLGAECLLHTLMDLPEKLQNAKPQPEVGVTFAPKVTPEFAVVRWDSLSSGQICNLDKAVTGLFCLTTQWNGILVKLHDVTDYTFSDSIFSNCDNNILRPGFVKFHKKMLIVLCSVRTCISVKRVGVFGKKVMSASDFNNGYIKKEPLERRYFR